MPRINSYPEAQSASSDDYFVMDGDTNGTRRIQSDNVVNPYSARELNEKFDEHSHLINEINDQITGMVNELAQKANLADMIYYLHYVAAESTAPDTGTTYSLADRIPNSYSYVQLDWYGDKPSDLTGTAWIFTIIPRSNSNYGMQFCLKHTNHSLYIRMKTKQSDNTYIWGNWSTFSDASLSVEGAFADAKAVGDALSGVRDSILRLSVRLGILEEELSSGVMRYKSSAHQSDVNSNLESNLIVRGPIFYPSDAPSKDALVLTHSTENGLIGYDQRSRMQLGFLPNGEILVRTSTYGTSDWLPWSDWSPVGTSNNIKDGAITEPKLAPNLLTPYLHYVVAETTTPPVGTTYSLADRTPNSYSQVNALEWYGDKPSDLTGTAWIFTIIPRSTSSFGIQFCLKHTNKSLYMRRKGKVPGTESTYAWGEWSTFSDASLSVEGAFADAKAVRDALALKANTQDVRDALALKANTQDVRDALALKANTQDVAKSLKYAVVTIDPNVDAADRKLSDLENNTYSWVDPDDFSDAPVSDGGMGWIFTIKSPISSYGMQLWISPKNLYCYSRRCAIQNHEVAWTEWHAMTDSTLTKAGVAADAKAVGDALANADIPVNYKSGAVYYSFGDSSTRGRIGTWDGSITNSTKVYPNAVASMLHMTLKNKAVSGQGLIGDWGRAKANKGIIEMIADLDMSDASLITVGWAYNDDYAYGVYGNPANMGSYTDVTTVDVTDTEAVKALISYSSNGNPHTYGTSVIGYYYTILKLLQTKCPNAQIVLVTGYGHPGGNSAQQINATLIDQFSHTFTFKDGVHTVKELYDELEKMANLHGWCCVNQSKGCAFNEFNASVIFGDFAHPIESGYVAYSNNLAPRIASFYANRTFATDNL